jgi:hypothetical protein
MATHNRNAAVDGMTRAEQIVRFFLENSEHYKWEGEPLTKREGRIRLRDWAERPVAPG